MQSNTAMDLPPSYTSAKAVDQMTPADRLKSLEEFAKSKETVRPGEDGTLPYNSVGGMNRLAFGGPMPGTEYDERFLPAPMYQDVYGKSSENSQKERGKVKKLFDKIKGSSKKTPS